MNKSLSQLIRSTKEYSDVCDTCKDEILIYPTISGRTDYSQDEVEQITLKRIIDKLQAKEQECEELKFTIKHTGLLDLMNENNELKQNCEELKDEILSLRKDGKKACDYCVDYITKEKQAYKYKQALDEIYNVVFIDDINCEVSKEVQDLSNTVINIINKAKERS